MRLITFLLMLVLIPLAESKSKQEDLKLEILNFEIYSRENFKVKDIRNAWRFDNYIYDSVPINKINVKLTNIGNRKIVLIIGKKFDKTEYLLHKNINLIVFDTKDSIIQLKSPQLLLQSNGQSLINRLETSKWESYLLEEEMNLKYYKQKEGDLKSNKRIKRNENYNFQEMNYVVIHPGEVKYFNFYITLPVFQTDETGYYYYELNSLKNYYSRLSLVNDSVYIKENLSENQLKEIKDNGYEIFDGKIISNKVPIKFIKM